MKVVQGDLLELAMDGEFDVIVHGCNCFCQMGAGIARTIRHNVPQAYIQDIQTIKGDRSKLGTYTVSVVDVTERRRKKRTSPAAATGSGFGSHRGGGDRADGSGSDDRANKDGDEDGGDNNSIHHSFLIVNAYTQYHWKTGPGIVNANYDAIRQVFSLIATDFKGRRIGYPKIGAGLAGGDWKIITKIIDNELRGEDHTLVEFNKNAINDW